MARLRRRASSSPTTATSSSPIICSVPSSRGCASLQRASGRNSTSRRLLGIRRGGRPEANRAHPRCVVATAGQSDATTPRRRTRSCPKCVKSRSSRAVRSSRAQLRVGWIARSATTAPARSTRSRRPARDSRRSCRAARRRRAPPSCRSSTISWRNPWKSSRFQHESSLGAQTAGGPGGIPDDGQRTGARATAARHEARFRRPVRHSIEPFFTFTMSDTDSDAPPEPPAEAEAQPAQFEVEPSKPLSFEVIAPESAWLFRSNL